jgi:hypothetical protein
MIKWNRHRVKKIGLEFKKICSGMSETSPTISIHALRARII